MSTDRGIDDDEVHRHAMEYYAAIKKNKMMSFSETWVDLESVILSELSQTEEEEKYCMASLICGI